MNRHKKWGIIALVICIIGGIVMFSLNHPKRKNVGRENENRTG